VPPQVSAAGVLVPASGPVRHILPALQLRIVELEVVEIVVSVEATGHGSALSRMPTRVALAGLDHARRAVVEGQCLRRAGVRVVSRAAPGMAIELVRCPRLRGRESNVRELLGCK
ncbi:MAG: hypothetical protein ACK56I_30600, partial [bacterium]